MSLASRTVEIVHADTRRRAHRSIPTITFEGIDGVGKTTMARRIAEELAPCRLVHWSAPTGSHADMAAAWLVEIGDMVADRKRGIATVYDRFWLSTLVYAQTRHDKGDFAFVEHICDGAREIMKYTPNVINVLMRRNFDDTCKALADRNESWPLLKREMELFDQLAAPDWLRLDLGAGADRLVKALL